MPSRWLLDRVSDAYADAVQHKDWRLLRAVYHRDALVAAAVREGEPLTVDEFLSELAAHPGYSLVGPRSMVPFDEHAGAIQSRMCLPGPTGSLQTVDRTLLFTFIESLVYRQLNLGSVKQAAAFYEQHGVSLAMQLSATSPG